MQAKQRPIAIIGAALIVAGSFFGLLTLDVAVLTHHRVAAYWIERLLKLNINAAVFVDSATLDNSGTVTLKDFRISSPSFNIHLSKLLIGFETDTLTPAFIKGSVSRLRLKIAKDWSMPFNKLIKSSTTSVERPEKIPTISLALADIEVSLEGFAERRIRVEKGRVFVCQVGKTVCVSVEAEIKGVGTLVAEVQVEEESVTGTVRVRVDDVMRTLAMLPEEMFPKVLGSVKGGVGEIDALFSWRDGKPRFSFVAVLGKMRFAVPKTKLTIDKIKVLLTGDYEEDLSVRGVGSGVVPSGGVCGFAFSFSSMEDLRFGLDAWAQEVVINEKLRAALPIAENVFKMLRPSGKADCRFKLKHHKKTRFQIEIICRPETSVDACWFPYRVTNLRGKVLVSESDVRFNVDSLMPKGRIHAEGYVGLEDDGYVVHIEGCGVEVDERIKAALPKEVSDILEKLGVEGGVEFSVNVQRGDSGRTDWRVDVELAGLRLLPRDMPVCVKLSDGYVVVRESGVQLRNIRGEVEGGSFSVDDFTIPYKSSDFLLQVEVDGVKVSKSLMRTLLGKVGIDSEDWVAEGVADATLRFVKQGDAFLFNGEARLKKMRILYRGFPVEMRDVEGLLRFSEEDVEVVALRGKAGGGTSVVWGGVRKQGTKWLTRLRVEAYDVVVDNRLREALPDFARRYFDIFNPRGQADFACHLDGPTDNLGCSLTITLRHCSLRIPHFSYPITDLSGKVQIDVPTASILFDNVCAREGAILVSGSSLQQGQKRVTHITLRLRGLEVDDDLLAAVPGGQTLSALNLSGRISGCVHLSIVQDKKTSISYTATLRPLRCSLEAGVEFDNISGKVLINGTYDGQRNYLDPIRLELEGMTVYGFRIEHILCVLTVGEKFVRFSELKGNVYGGRLKGSVKLIGDTAEVRLSVSQASVRKAAEHLFARKMGRVSGYVSASFSGKFGKDSFSGEGRIRMRHANLWQVPFFSELVRVLSLGAVEGVPFDKAGARFVLQKNRIKFLDAYFYSAVIGLKGRGSLYYKGKLRFKFAIKIAPGIMKYLPLVNWVIDFIKNNIVEILVRGTPKRPKIILAPFQPLVDFFRTED